ncbi:hypothetical protein Tco_0938572 [Tanacetum coccineum]|uniref:Uncharacterized protein n=1 Tax=Tanacetum coccineum TaxID=301880 RepID=A0ABQ5DIF1_9ASTR
MVEKLCDWSALQGKGSTIPVESHHTPTSAPSTSQPPTSSPSMPTTHLAKEAALIPHDLPLPRNVESLESDLNQTKQTYGAAYTKLIMKVKKLEHKVKSIKARRKVRFVISDDEDDLEDPSKQGRKIAQIDEDEGITLVQMEGYERLLWEDLITVFEPSKDDEVWKAQQDYTLISWRLFNSCGIHVLLMDTGIAIHMLVEKTYPLTQEMLSRMLSGKLEVDNESEMAFELLRFTRS